MVIVDCPPDALLRLRSSLPEPNGNQNGNPNGGDESKEVIEENTYDDVEEILAYVAALSSTLSGVQDFEASSWKDGLGPYLREVFSHSQEEAVEGTLERFRVATKRAMLEGTGDAAVDDDEEETGEVLCDVRFSLAYGGKILLHQTPLKMRRGHRYALVGQNGAGKTTLMTAIDGGKLEGWPTHLSTEYVDSGSNVNVVHEAKQVMDHLVSSTGRPVEDCAKMLDTLKFTDAMRNGTIGELSGGWQMKLRLAKAVLVDADILLLDEPTNHLDAATVQWLVDYLNALEHTTVVTVSHDTQFVENTCTDVIHYEKRPQEWGTDYRKLVQYRGRMSAFVQKIPQAKHYFELATTDLKFKFPDPGRLEGVKTSTQKFLEMENVDFRYPGADKNQLTDVNLKMTLSSRVAVVGANGAGKTTLIKMIVGDTQPSNVGVCRFYCHHNLRIAYVAQHSFHHVEEHVENSPASYIQWRFKDGYDKEKLDSAGYRLTDEEKQVAEDFGLEDIWSRRLRAGTLEYEVKKVGVPEKDNKYYSRDDLLCMGLEKTLKQADEKIAAREAGLDLRPCTTTEIQRHLDDFGLAQEFGTYGKIRGLSGGQKVKLVLAAAMWNQPHLLVLDEPTNYLDREALGALSAALNEWGGSVLMISHNKEFYGSVCKEEWIVGDGRVIVQGASSERKLKVRTKKIKAEDFAKEPDVEGAVEKAGGNINSDGDKYKDATTNFWGKAVSKKEGRNFDKAKKKGDVELMRKILQIPMGKVMPGHEELGDGKTVPNNN